MRAPHAPAWLRPLALAAAATATGCYAVELQPAVPWHLPEGVEDCANFDNFRPIALAQASDADRHALADWDPPGPVHRGSEAAAGRMVMAYARSCGVEKVARAAGELVAMPIVAGAPAEERARGLQAMRKWLQRFAVQAGLSFVAYGRDDAWELSLGTGPRALTWVGHADVAAPGDGWQGDPFVLRRADGALWGRGIEDDKAPLAAALLALFWINQAGLRVNQQLTVAILTDTGAGGARAARYLRRAPPAAATIALDGSYPVVTHASGSASWTWTLDHPPARTPGTPHAPTIVAVSGGEGGARIPGSASMTVQAGAQQSSAAFAAAIGQAIAEENARRATAALPVEVGVTLREGGRAATIEARGRAVHAAAATAGYNALWPLAQVTQSLRAGDHGAGKMLAVVARFFDQDPLGNKLHLAASDAAVGPLTVAATGLTADAAHSRLSLDVRWPGGQQRDVLIAQLARALALVQVSVDTRIRATGPPTLAAPWTSGAAPSLVATLLGAYREVAGTPGSAVSTRGDTLARLYPDAVAFGPLLPGRAQTAASAHEAMSLEDVGTMTRLMVAATIALLPPPPPPPAKNFRVR